MFTAAQTIDVGANKMKVGDIDKVEIGSFKKIDHGAVNTANAGAAKTTDVGTEDGSDSEEPSQGMGWFKGSVSESLGWSMKGSLLGTQRRESCTMLKAVKHNGGSRLSDADKDDAQRGVDSSVLKYACDAAPKCPFRGSLEATQQHEALCPILKAGNTLTKQDDEASRPAGAEKKEEVVERHAESGDG
eukprot:1597775-Rhodomonas_salina.1